MEIMPHKIPPYVQVETTRHGRRVYYFRRSRKDKRIRLPDLGTDAFRPAYEAALKGEALASPRNEPAAQTFAWAVLRYKESAGWASLSPATRRQRDNILGNLVDKIGREPLSRFKSEGIQLSIDKRRDTPAQARNIRDALRGLFDWARLNGHVKANPTDGVKVPKRDKRSEGFKAWSEEDVARYRAHWPLGTRQRVWLEVLLNTGLRRGDATRLGRQHLRGSFFSIKTEKTGEEVHTPMVPELLEAIDAGPTGDLAFICGENGTPLVKESFGNLFRKACNDAACKGLSAHGLRKLAATRLANIGCSESELEAIFGWHGGYMAARYTRTANRKRLAESAMERMQNTSLPHLAAGAGIAPEKPIKSRG